MEEDNIHQIVKLAVVFVREKHPDNIHPTDGVHDQREGSSE